MPLYNAGYMENHKNAMAGPCHACIAKNMMSYNFKIHVICTLKINYKYEWTLKDVIK